MSELADENHDLHKKFTRISEELFNHTVECVISYIQKWTFWRKPLEPGLHVAITLRFLATGDSYKSVAYSLCVAHKHNQQDCARDL